MKNYLTFSLFTFTFSFFLSAFGGPDDALVSFSTKGPDTYLDGTVVKDGECYALVWTKSGATFAGIAADGKAVGSDSEVLVFAPIAKDGHCPPALFEIDAMLAKKYADGSFSIYLLDTRLANGAVGGVSAGGVPVAVNGYGAAKSGEATSSSLQGMEDDSSDRSGQETASPLVRVTTRSALPADTPKPQITAIKIVGDKVFLTVKNTIPCLQYVANEVKVEGQGQGGESSTVNLQPSTSTFSPAQGASKADEEIVVIAPKKGDSGFFSVGRK